MRCISSEHEKLLSITEAAKQCPSRPSVATVWRWVLNGLSGVKLESVKVGGRRFTSAEAIDRFISETTAHADGEPVPQRTPTRRKKDLQRAKRELEDAGV